MKKFKKNDDILALDFDGVISNSINECLVSGHNAFATLSNRAHVKMVTELDSQWVENAIDIRNYIRNGEDYVYIALALEKAKAIHNQDDFDAFKKAHIQHQQAFFDSFFSERLAFAERDAQQWAALSPLYAGVKELLLALPQQSIHIVTTKKLIFVEKILAANGIRLVQENLHDTSNGLSKKQIIEDILASNNKSPKQCYFIDDQIDTLIKTKPSGINCILAEWGYNNQKQHDKAIEKNIPIFTLNQFIEFFGEEI